MAQLPPKIPTMSTPNWPDLSHQKICTLLPPPPTTTSTTVPNPSWVDEFLDFSSVRRGTHRRSVSDSMAFLDAPHQMVTRHIGNNIDDRDEDEDDRFDGFVDEEQLFMSMFNHHVISPPAAVGPTLSSSDRSTPSDHNSINDENKHDRHQPQQQQPKNESDEVQSSCKSDTQAAAAACVAVTNVASDDRIFDPKRVKRILANRQSAQRSRVRKLQYISELERSVNTLQAKISVLSPRVAFLDHQRLLLNVDNSALKQRIAALAQDKLFKDAHQEALKREIERLRQVYHQQSVNKTESKPPSSSPPPSSDTNGSTEKEEEIFSV